MRKQKGFTLIELLIVVAIILIIAAIAIPNLLRSKMAANEASAVGSVRTVVTSEVAYASTYPDQGFTGTLTNLGQPASGANPSSTAAGLIDNILSAGSKSGYTLALGGTGTAPSTTFTIKNTPLSNQTGTRQFCADQTGVMRYDPAGVGGSCTGSSSAMQ